MKIYYSINRWVSGYPVHWIDEKGEEQSVIFPVKDPGEASQEFLKDHSGAIYLEWPSFCTRLVRISGEREKLAGWKEGRAING